MYHTVDTSSEVPDFLLAVVENNQKQMDHTRIPFCFLLPSLPQTMASFLEANASNGDHLLYWTALLYRIYELHIINDLLQKIGLKDDIAYMRTLLPLLQVQ